MATKKKTVAPIIPKAGELGAQQVMSYPRMVLIKNNTISRTLESVTRTILSPYSEKSVEVKSESELLQIQSNFKQLNILNRWQDGLQVVVDILPVVEKTAEDAKTVVQEPNNA